MSNDREFKRVIAFVKGKEKMKAVQVGFAYQTPKGETAVQIDALPRDPSWDGKLLITSQQAHSDAGGGQSQGGPRAPGGGGQAPQRGFEGEDIPF